MHGNSRVPSLGYQFAPVSPTSKFSMKIFVHIESLEGLLLKKKKKYLVITR